MPEGGYDTVGGLVLRELGRIPAQGDRAVVAGVVLTVTRDEVAGLIAQSQREGLLDQSRHERLTSALGFDTVTIGDITIPMARVHPAGPAGRTPARTVPAPIVDTRHALEAVEDSVILLTVSKAVPDSHR